MKFQTSALTGMMLDFACAQFDSHCEGITWEFRDDHYVGLDRNDLDDPLEVVTIICDPSDLNRKVDLCLQYKLQMQLVYSPSTNWGRGGELIERERISIDQPKLPPIQATIKKFYGEGDTPLIAAMRAFVASKAGDSIELAGAV